MSNIRKIAKNTAILFIAQIISNLLAFVYTIYTARYLGPTDFGIISFAIAFTTIFSVFGDFGLQSFIIREVARDKTLTARYLASGSLIKGVMAAVTFGLIIVAINVMGCVGDTVAVIYLLSISVILSSFTLLFQSIYQAHERMEYQGIGQGLNSLLILIGVMGAIYLKLNIISIAVIYAISGIIVLLYNIIIIKLKFSDKVAVKRVQTLIIDQSFLELAIRESVPFGLIVLFSNIYNWIDIVFLSIIKGEEVVGWYSAAFRLVVTLSFIPAALLGAMYPMMSRYYKSAGDALNISFEKSFKYLMSISFPIACGTTILSGRFISLFYGSEYSQSAVALSILIWTIVFIFANWVFNTLLYAINRQAIVTKVYLIAALLSIIFNIIFIPCYSYIAASITKVAVEGVIFILVFIAVYASGFSEQIKSSYKIVLKIIVASIIMGVFTWIFSQINLIVLIISSAAIYLFVLIALKVFDNTDVALLKQLSNKN